MSYNSTFCIHLLIVYIANIQPIHEPDKIADKYSIRCGEDTLIRKVSSLDLQHFILNFLPHLYNSLQTVHQRSPLYLPLLFLLRHLLKRYDFRDVLMYLSLLLGLSPWYSLIIIYQAYGNSHRCAYV